MAVVSMKQLLEAGVHFGHQTRRWNPKMAKYIFTERNGIYIIDLQKTVKKLDEAYNYVKEVAAEGGDILFVGTKKQAQESIRDEALRCGMHYVNARWLGGMMTNFRTIRKRIDRMDQLAKMKENGTFELLPKKFALSQLQRVYEVVLERKLDKRNFRKKVLATGLLVETDEVQQDVAHRAARLYRFDEVKYRRLAKAGFHFEV